MERSPCLECDLLHEDKRNPDCEACQKKDQYVGRLGRPNENLPIEMTDMADKKQIRRWTPGELKYLKDYYLTMTNGEMSAELKRTENAVAFKMHQLKLRRSKPKIAPIKHSKEVPRPPDQTARPHHSALEPISTGKIDLLPPVGNLPALSNKDFLIIDFSSYPDLYDNLLKTASENFRTPELQILFYCHHAINGQTAK
jgi:hypothetical protein